MIKSDAIGRHDGQHYSIPPPARSAVRPVLVDDRSRIPWDDRIIDAIVASPALPTVFPTTTDVLCNYAESLAAEGFSAIEVLARPLEAVLPVLREVFVRAERQVVHWGIGTIRTRDEALSATTLCPDFLVSPAFSRHVLEVAVEAGIPYIPGVYTFQDVQNVVDAYSEFNLTVRLLKLCPAMGVTPEYMQALLGCFPGIVFCPTGDVSLENYARWKQTPGIVAPMGAALVPQAWLEVGDFAAVRQRLRLVRDLSQEVLADPKPQ